MIERWADRVRLTVRDVVSPPKVIQTRIALPQTAAEWTPPRRPGRTRRRYQGPGATVSALVFLFVTIALMGGLYYGIRWATHAPGLVSGMIGGLELDSTLLGTSASSSNSGSSASSSASGSSTGNTSASASSRGASSDSSTRGSVGVPGSSSTTSTGAIKFATPSPTEAPIETPTPEPEQAQAQPTPTPERRTHIVQAGDNPAKIAAKYGVDATELMRVNNITDPRRLRVGQELIIPDAGATGGAAAAATGGPTSEPTSGPTATLAPRN